MSKQIGDSGFLWVFPLIYDAFAFVPQSLVGRISDKNPKICFGLYGIILLAVAGLMFWLLPSVSPFITVALLCLGNVFVHVNGAEVTLRCSNGHLSHSAIFVSGGSFGVITGRVFASVNIPYWFVIAMVLTGIPFVLLAEMYRRKADEKSDCPCSNFNYVNKKIPAAVIVIIAVFVVIVRGYMGYGIPTTWKKTVLQSVILYCAMGIGKALGGIVSDMIGVKKTAIFSATAALPFLLVGDNHMIVSLIGVMLFSMTMSITLAMLVSVFKHSPGLAFGWTTIGLFIGTAPIFFLRLTTVTANCVMITIFTVLSILAMIVALRKDGVTDEIC